MTLNKVKNSLLLPAVIAVAFSCSGGGSSAPTPKASSLAAPAGVKTTTAPLKVVVSWDPVAGATGYKVYYKNSAGVGSADSNVTVNGETAWNHTDGLAEGQAYYYRVSTVGADGESSMSAEVSATVTNALNSGCAPVHTGALWTKSDCGPKSDVIIGQGTAGDDGVALGSRPVNKARLTFTLSDVRANGSDVEVYFVWFCGGGCAPGSEANWHLINYSYDYVRLISQRFDGACPGNSVAGYGGACEDTDWNTDMVMDSSQSYKFDCTWDYEGSQDIECAMSKADGSVNYSTRRVPMHGSYNQLNDLWVGIISYGGKDVMPCTVTNYRFSVLSDKSH